MRRTNKKEDERTSNNNLNRYLMIALLIFIILISGFTVSMLLPVTLYSEVLNSVKLYRIQSPNDVEYLGYYEIKGYTPYNVIVDYPSIPVPETLGEAVKSFDIIVYGRIVEIDVVEAGGFYRWSFILYKLRIEDVYKGLELGIKYIYIAYLGSFDENKGLLMYDPDIGYFKVGQELIVFLNTDGIKIPDAITRNFRTTYAGSNYILRVEDGKIYPLNNLGFMTDLEGMSIEEFENKVKGGTN